MRQHILFSLSFQANPWDVYAAARKKVAFEEDEDSTDSSTPDGESQDKQYVVDSDGSIRSVENLRKLSDVKWVVLSLGGNESLTRVICRSAEPRTSISMPKSRPNS